VVSFVCPHLHEAAGALGDTRGRQSVCEKVQRFKENLLQIEYLCKIGSNENE
jgi:hypothetical protein